MLCLTARYRDDSVRFALVGGEARIGASSDNEFVLPFPGVSKVHAVVERRGNGVLLRDLGSRSGLIVDGRRVEEAQIVPGTTIQIGQALVVLGEVPSSELEAGIDPKRRNGSKTARPEPSTLAGVSSGLRSPAAGMRLIREIERAGSEFKSHPGEILARLRALLEADAVVLVAFSHGELAIQSAAGVVPPRRAYDGLLAGDALAGEAAHATRNPDGGHRAAAGWKQNGSEAALVAFFGPAAPPVASWERELISYITFKLSTPSNGRAPAPADRPAGASPTSRS